MITIETLFKEEKTDARTTLHKTLNITEKEIKEILTKKWTQKQTN